MKYLVLGSEGQIGRPLCEHLRAQGHQVFTFDIQINPLYDLRSKYNPQLDFLMRSCDFVFFLAFDVGGSTYLKKFEKTKKFLDNNIELMKHTFMALERHRKPFIFASSQMSNMNHSVYGVLKRIGEFYTNTLNGLNVKFWNVYGHETIVGKTHVITDFIATAATKQRIDCRTDGSELRQFLHTDDSSEALYILSQKYKDIDRNEELAITSFEWHSIRDIAFKIKSLLECDIQFATATDEVQLDSRNEPSRYIEKFWQPKVKLLSGIRKVAKQMGHLND